MARVSMMQNVGSQLPPKIESKLEEDLLESATEAELEEAGRISIECLNDLQAGRIMPIESYLEQYPELNPVLLRSILTMSIALHQGVTGKSIPNFAS